MQPPMDFRLFSTDKSWYAAYWSEPSPPERATPSSRLRRIVGFLLRERIRDDRRPPVSAIGPGAPAAQSLVTNT